MKFPHESGQGLVVVRWKNEQYLLHPNSVKALPSDNQRQRKSIDRLQPDETGNLKWKPAEVKRPRFTSSDQTANNYSPRIFALLVKTGCSKHQT
jgi:hypothetical protein